MSDHAERAVDALLADIEWEETGAVAIDDALPYATHVGVVDLGGIPVTVYQLNTGQRVFSADDLADLFAEWAKR